MVGAQHMLFLFPSIQALLFLTRANLTASQVALAPLLSITSMDWIPIK